MRASGSSEESCSEQVGVGGAWGVDSGSWWCVGGEPRRSRGGDGGRLVDGDALGGVEDEEPLRYSWQEVRRR